VAARSFGDLGFGLRDVKVDHWQTTVTVLAACGNVDGYVPEGDNLSLADMARTRPTETNPGSAYGAADLGLNAAGRRIRKTVSAKTKVEVRDKLRELHRERGHRAAVHGGSTPWVMRWRTG
jgi:hypothetical protein